MVHGNISLEVIELALHQEIAVTLSTLNGSRTDWSGSSRMNSGRIRVLIRIQNKNTYPAFKLLANTSKGVPRFPFCAKDPIKTVMCYADTTRRSARKSARLPTGPSTHASALQSALRQSALRFIRRPEKRWDRETVKGHLALGLPLPFCPRLTSLSRAREKGTSGGVFYLDIY